MVEVGKLEKGRGMKISEMRRPGERVDAHVVWLGFGKGEGSEALVY